MKPLAQILIEDGAVGAPGVAWRTNPTTGLILPATKSIGFVTDGAERWRIDATGLLTPRTDAALDIGDATHRVKDLYLSGVLKTMAAPTPYTPALTASGSNPTLGTGSSVLGNYIQIGKLTLGWATVIFGTAGTAFGTGNYSISLPGTTDSAIHSTRDALGIWSARDPGAGTVYSGMARTTSASATSLLLNASAGGSVTPTSPYTQANSSDLHMFFAYWST